MSIKNYPCNLSPNGFCPDCTNDGPLCDFDECPYVGESICVCEECNDEAMNRARDDDYAEF